MYQKAIPSDAEPILRLINYHAARGQMLFRTLEDIQKHLDDFFVCKEHGNVLAACSLQNGWEKLLEIRSLAVHPHHYRRGIGAALVRACMEEAAETDMERIFVLTYAMPFFAKLGFEKIDKSALPYKIWVDCRGCPKQENCDETAMIRDLRPLWAAPMGNSARPEQRAIRMAGKF